MSPFVIHYSRYHGSYQEDFDTYESAMDFVAWLSEGDGWVNDVVDPSGKVLWSDTPNEASKALWDEIGRRWEIKDKERQATCTHEWVFNIFGKPPRFCKYCLLKEVSP